MNQNSSPSLLVIEDSDEDFTALVRVANKIITNGSIYRCEDGEEALDFLYRESEYCDKSTCPRPSLILLDLNLPGIDGREVLETIKQDRNLQTIPVVVFSTSDNSKDIEACYRRGVSGYIVKPMDTQLLNRLVKTFLTYWFGTVKLPTV